jgi:hypothetical protein
MNNILNKRSAKILRIFYLKVLIQHDSTQIMNYNNRITIIIIVKKLYGGKFLWLKEKLTNLAE